MSSEPFPNDLIGYGYTVAPIYRTDIVQTWGGHEQRNQSWSQPLRRWGIAVVAMDDTERAALISFFLARAGAFDTFIWTDPVDGTSYTVRFEQDDPEISTEHFQGHYSELTMIEVRA